jgi:hypothetical protein
VVFIRDSANAVICSGRGVAIEGRGIGVAIEGRGVAIEGKGVYNFNTSKITLVVDINTIIKNVMQINAI